MSGARLACLVLGASLLLLSSAALVADDAQAADDGAFYIIYGHVMTSSGQPVPDNTLVSARNLDRTDDNTMYFYTYTDQASGGRYTVNLHAPGAPTAYNSMAYTDGDRIRISCNYGDESGTVTHVVDVSSGASKQLDFMMEPVPEPPKDDKWYTDPMTIGIAAVVAIVAAAVVWYLFVPPKDGR